MTEFHSNASVEGVTNVISGDSQLVVLNSGGGTSPKTDILNENIRQRRAIMFEHLALIPIFTGQDPMLNLNTFLHKFNEISDYLLWQQEDKLFALNQRLAGAAQVLVANHREEINTFEGVVNLLKDRFLEKKGLADIFNEFWLFTQPQNMKVKDYLAIAKQKVKKIVKAQNIPPNLWDKTENDWLMAMLKKNLSVQIRRGVLARAPQTLEELEKIAINEEEAYFAVQTDIPSNEGVFAINHSRGVEQGKTQVEELNKVILDLSNQLKNLNVKVDQLQKNEGSLSHERENFQDHQVVCFNCGKQGHISKFCRDFRPNFNSQGGNRQNFTMQNRGFNSQGGNRQNFTMQNRGYNSQGAVRQNFNGQNRDYNSQGGVSQNFNEQNRGHRSNFNRINRGGNNSQGEFRQNFNYQNRGYINNGRYQRGNESQNSNNQNLNF